MYDVAIFGGGSAGIGAAIAAGNRGLKTIVLEKNKIMEGTSNNTLRIIHGGFRYLQSFNLPRVLESIHDQAWLLREYPDLVKELPCLMPLKRYGMKSRIPVTLASCLFSFLSKLKAPKVISSKEAEKLNVDAPYGALCWYDASVAEPLVLRDKLVERVKSLGVEVKENTEVSTVKKSDNGYQVGLKGGETVGAKYVVNTLGPWLDSIPSQAPPLTKPMWCLAFNVELITTPYWDFHYALASETHSKRLLFAVPRNGKLAIGTWYHKFSGDLDNLKVDQVLVDEALKDIRDAYPSISDLLISRFDIGVLPMKELDSNEPRLYTSEIIENNNGSIRVISTKYTTFISQGEKILRKLCY